MLNSSNLFKLLVIAALGVIMTTAMTITITTTATTAYAEPKANRTYYCFPFDFIDRSTGEILTGSTACDDTSKECEELKTKFDADPVVVSTGECFKFKDVNPHNPK